MDGRHIETTSDGSIYPLQQKKKLLHITAEKEKPTSCQRIPPTKTAVWQIVSQRVRGANQ